MEVCKMEGMKAIPYIALVIAISGIVLGAGAIVLDKFEWILYSTNQLNKKRRIVTDILVSVRTNLL